jgi:hypothetical protein
MNNASVMDGAAGLLDAAGRDPDGVLSPVAATRAPQAADELHRAGAVPVLDATRCCRQRRSAKRCDCCPRCRRRSSSPKQC